MASCYQIRSQIVTWAPVLTTQCSQWQDQGHSACTDLRDEGSQVCSQYADNGHQACSNWSKNCCTWKPCVWFCNAFTWVCDGWFWVTNLLCLLYVWVANWVCHLWMWVANWVCIALIYVVRYVIVAIAWVVWFVCTMFASVPGTVRCFRDTPRNPLSKPGWKLTFEDDFTTGAINKSKWRTGSPWWPNSYSPPPPDPHQWYDPACLSFGASTVKLAAKKQSAWIDPASGKLQFTPAPAGVPEIPYAVGWLEWQPAHKQRRGYFEIRCKIPNTPDMWPAFWLYGKDPEEIDIFEFYTRKRTREFNSSHHWGPDKPNKLTETRTHKVCRPATRFRIYACEWSSTDIRWYVDNRLVRIATKGIPEFEGPMTLIVNAAVDGRAPDGNPLHHQQDPASSTYPNYFEVDYVRAYSR